MATEWIDLPLEDRADPEGLHAFLEACREAAEEAGEARLASICLAVRHIDPLAVLDSIYEGQAAHFYQENPHREWALAGAEAVLQGSWEGPGRFRAVKAFSEDVARRTIAVGDRRLPFSGPLVFCGFSFFEETQGREALFPAAMAFVPQWQVGRRGHQYVAVANTLIHPGMDTAPAAQRIWGAHEKFGAFDYGSPPEPPVYRILSEEETGAEGSFQANVSKALEAIAGGAYEKIVLARAVDLRFDNPCQPLRILNRLRRDYPRCTGFSLQTEEGDSFIGATPERLVAVDGGRFYTEAIAGSAPRGKTAAEDAGHAHYLLGSEKDLREHRHVVDSIRRRLEGLDLQPRVGSGPGLISLPNVQHLHTPVEGDLPEGLHLLDLAEVLHPTPAVGGTPREAALADIRRWEPFDRGLFAGLSGWFDLEGNGEFVVGIRSALVREACARLFAGAGIVAGSDPGREFRETSMKMQALLDCIRGSAG